MLKLTKLHNAFSIVVSQVIAIDYISMLLRHRPIKDRELHVTRQLR